MVNLAVLVGVDAAEKIGFWVGLCGSWGSLLRPAYQINAQSKISAYNLLQRTEWDAELNS